MVFRDSRQADKDSPSRTEQTRTPHELVAINLAGLNGILSSQGLPDLNGRIDWA